MAIETKRIDDSSIPLVQDLAGITIPVMQGGVSKRLMADQLLMNSTAYGVRIDDNVSNPELTRVGSQVLHQSLPLQNKMRRCILDETGSVAYYLDKYNSNLKESGTVAKLDGTDGDVMVELPGFWYRVDVLGADKYEFWKSETQLAGFLWSPPEYISAFQATLDRTIAGLIKLVSVANSTPNFRGGNNNAAWDAETRTLLGRPATATSRINFTDYARNKGEHGLNGAGWNQLNYHAYWKLFWLITVEFANRNSQAPFNAALDVNGYRQGGLGDGVTTLTSSLWSGWNNYYPFIPCGHTISLGNQTGLVPFTMPAEYDPSQPVVQVPSYRGVENPFGHIYHWLEGVNIRKQSDADGGRSTAFIADNPANFNANNYNGYREAGDIKRNDGYVRSLLMGSRGDILPKASGGGSTTYWCDYGYNGNLPASGTQIRGVIVGGYATYGASAGLLCSYSHSVPSSANAIIGARLCFTPNP